MVEKIITKTHWGGVVDIPDTVLHVVHFLQVWTDGHWAVLLKCVKFYSRVALTESQKEIFEKVATYFKEDVDSMSKDFVFILGRFSNCLKYYCNAF